MNRIAFTCFDAKGYNTYGRTFIKSFLDHWPIPLWLFYNGKTPIGIPSAVNVVNMQDDDEYTEFLFQHGDNPIANGYRDGKIDYRFQAVKFCHKVFAQTSPFKPECDQWIWIDADVETTRFIDSSFFERACPWNVIASYLGRTDWHHSECGFMSYNLPMAAVFLGELRRTYTSGELFTLPEWHDSFVWDVVRAAVGGPFFNISKNIRGTNPWPKTVLGEYMSHEKGPVAKIEKYGTYV